MKKKVGFFKFIGILVLLTLFVNLILSLISTYTPIRFVKPHSIIEPPEIFYSLNIGNVVLNINQTVLNTWAIMLILIIILILGTRKLSIDNPSKFQIILEEFYGFIMKNFLEGYKEYTKKFIGFFSAMFSMIMLINISMFLFPFVFYWKKEHGVIAVKPFFRTATADMNTTIGLALVVFVVFVGAAIYRVGIIGFIKELCQPIILMLPLNIISELAKPINISMRLFGNMFAGIVIMALIYGLVIPNALSTVTSNVLQGGFSFAVAWPNILQIYLDFFIGLLQAFIFTVLSSAYIKQMLIEEE